MPMLTTINRAVYTPAMTVDRPAVSRRAGILAAAAQLFAQRGYHGTGEPSQPVPEPIRKLAPR